MRHGPPAEDAPRFLLSDHEPAYLSLLRSGELEARRDVARAWLDACRACPRECGAQRSAGERGFCGVGEDAVVASAFPHTGEEPALSGWCGSGTIFFSQCNLRCTFCQNDDIAHTLSGREHAPGELAQMMLALESAGCHNINLVTPSHVVPQVVLALADAALDGLTLPVVYNTSAYDSLESLALLDGLVDMYMPDFKLWEPETAQLFLGTPDYPERARAALRAMQSQVGVLRVDEQGLARRGVLLRHLVMPELADESAAILAWVAEELSPDTVVNVMGQYHPAGTALTDPRLAQIGRRPRAEELEEAQRAARRAGLWRFADAMRVGRGLR